MRAVLQRVSSAEVLVDGVVKGRIGKGYLVYLGVEKGDGAKDLEFIISKLLSLRLFPDEQGRFDRDITQAGGAVLLVSQFTLLADTRKGRRPSFDRAARPEEAKTLYLEAIKGLEAAGVAVGSGEFQAHMDVESVNDGPVTVLIDSRA